jgi:hypothetical protein
MDAESNSRNQIALSVLGVSAGADPGMRSLRSFHPGLIEPDPFSKSIALNQGLANVA